jgi:diacylglycerol kinase
MTDSGFSVRSRLRSFKYAFRGLRLLLKYEHNSRVHLFIAVIAVALGFMLKIRPVEWLIVVIVTGIVFIAELFNTALETISDIVDNEWNEKIGQAKDYAAAAVFVSAIMSVVAGGIIFVPKLLGLLK